MTRLGGFLLVLCVATLATGVVAAGCDIPGTLLETIIIGNGEKQHLHAIATAEPDKETAGKPAVDVVIYRVTETGETAMSEKRLASSNDVYRSDNNNLFAKADADIQLQKGEEAKIKVTVSYREAAAPTVALDIDGKCWNLPSK